MLGRQLENFILLLAHRVQALHLSLVKSVNYLLKNSLNDFRLTLQVLLVYYLLHTRYVIFQLPLLVDDIPNHAILLLLVGCFRAFFPGGFFVKIS